MTAADASPPTALFEPVGADGWMATELARGPWDPRHCHGGPVSALLARAVEHVETGPTPARPRPTGRSLGSRWSSPGRCPSACR